MTTTSTTEPTRLAVRNRRGVEADLTMPLPSALAVQVRERSEQHRKVADKLGALREQVVALARQLAEQERRDEERAAAAIASGRTPGRRQKAASLRTNLADAESEVASFENGLRKSAAGLLQAALPHVGAAVEQATAEHERALARAHDLLSATDAALADADRAAAERAWLADLAAGSPSIEPYREGTSGMATIARLRVALGQAVAEFDHRHAEAEAQRQRDEQWQREQDAERQRHEAQARRDDEARRVVIAGGVIESIGGKPVRRGAFGVEPVGDDEGGER